MKKLFIALVLISTTGQVFAQTNEKELDASIKRVFFIGLDNLEKVKVELTNVNALEYLELNIDSVLARVKTARLHLEDTLAAEVYPRTLEFDIRSAETDVHIQEHKFHGKRFRVTQEGLAQLKTHQDTVIIIGHTNNATETYRLSFYVNDLSNIYSYGRRLEDNFGNLRTKIHQQWRDLGTRGMYLKSMPNITASKAYGMRGKNDAIVLLLSVDVQNYTDKFVPSLTIGMSWLKRGQTLQREYSIVSESHFAFARDAAGKRKNYLNNFLTVSYGQALNTENGPSPNLYPFISLGYLFKEKGDVYANNTFKLGLGRFSFSHGSTKIEPIIYFNNFFKNASPSLRIVQRF